MISHMYPLSETTVPTCLMSVVIKASQGSSDNLMRRRLRSQDITEGGLLLEISNLRNPSPGETSLG